MRKQERNPLTKKDPRKICIKDQRKVCGFTLIEVMVTIFIITVGLIGAFNVIQNITVQSRLAASRLTAVYLAQEGIEMIRNQRDSNWIEDVNLNWARNIPPNIAPRVCDVSFPPGILGKFERICSVTSTATDMEVSVEVKWSERGVDYSVTSATELYNWLE